MKRTWEARCDTIFRNTPVDIGQIVKLAENDLIMEIARLTPPFVDCAIVHPHHQTPPPRGRLKLNVDASFKEGFAALAILGRDEA